MVSKPRGHTNWRQLSQALASHLVQMQLEGRDGSIKLGAPGLPYFHREAAV